VGTREAAVAGAVEQGWSATKARPLDGRSDAVDPAHGCAVARPAKRANTKQHDLDRHLYKERHLVECFFQRIKRMRRIAMRYEGTSPRDLTPQPPSPWRERGAKRKIATSTPDATIDPV
jgi:hypothetical protein